MTPTGVGALFVFHVVTERLPLTSLHLPACRHACRNLGAGFGSIPVRLPTNPLSFSGIT